MRVGMKDIKYKEGEWQSLSEGIVLLTSSGLFQWITEADRISDDAKSSCDTYDVDHAIDIDTASNTNYEETEHRLTLLQQAIQHVPDTLSGSVDQPFYNAMDSLMEKLSNMNIMGYETMARGSFSNGVNSAGVTMPKMKVTLEELLGNSSPLTDYLRVEYNQMKQQIGDVSFEDYKKMAFADSSFDYYSRNEKVKGLAVTLVINGAVLVIGGMLPWPLMVALGLTSGGKNISEAWRGKDLFTGKELSTGDRILRGLSGVADVALAGYGTYKGVKALKGTKDVVVSEKSVSRLSDLTEVEKLKIANQYKQTAPIGIPDSAKINAKTMNAGYEQITYKWNDGQFKYEVRWHTRTPGAPANQGNTWVVQRTIPGNGGNKPQTLFKTGENEWIEGHKWYDAINARKAGNATPEQIRILDKGHWKE